jgi:plasmid stabilization system protein ParE
MARSKPYRVHPEVWVEIESADEWYLHRSLHASAAFIAAVSDAFDTVSQAPQRWPNYLHGTRRFLLHRFPFAVIYLYDPEAVTIVAVAHNKRKPGYWKRRL